MKAAPEEEEAPRQTIAPTIITILKEFIDVLDEEEDRKVTLKLNTIMLSFCLMMKI